MMHWVFSQHWYFWYALAGVVAGSVGAVRNRRYYNGVELLCVATGLAVWWLLILLVEIAEDASRRRSLRRQRDT